MKSLLLKSLLLFSSVALSVGLNKSVNFGRYIYQNQDDSDDANCDDKMADSCFRDVYTNLQCHFKSIAVPDLSCTKKNVDDLCSAINEALDCSSDLVNSDCRKYEGSDRFNRWLKGLRSVYTSLCSGNRDPLKNLINNAQCLSITSFITCMENDIKVKHVVDMLKVEWSVIGTAIAMANCNAKLSVPGENCTSSGGVINEMIHTFFENFGCGRNSGSPGLHFPNPIVYAMTYTLLGCAFLRFNYFITL